MSQDTLSLRVFQICSRDSFKENIANITKLIKTHANQHEFCLFPENSLYINIDKTKKTPKFDLAELKPLQELCESKKITLSLGSVPLFEGEKLFNRTLIIDDKGELTKAYDKVHLFKAEVGDISIDEGDLYASGDKPSIINVFGWRVGLSICFDLRFSDLYSYYAKKECDLILAPSAFLRITGKAHWEILLRARAIETQAYVAASAQAGVHKSDTGAIRKSYGHSMIVDPWGEVLCDLKEEEDTSKLIVLNKTKIQKMRKSIIMDRNQLKV